MFLPLVLFLFSVAGAQVVVNDTVLNLDYCNVSFDGQQSYSNLTVGGAWAKMGENNFSLVTDSGEAAVNIVELNSTYKEFSAKSGVDGQEMNFALSNLPASTSHTIHVSPLDTDFTRDTNSSGEIGFSFSYGSGGEVQNFRITRTVEEGGGGGGYGSVTPETVTPKENKTVTPEETEKPSGPVENESPTADFTASEQETKAGSPIEFDASESIDIDGRIVSYEWYFGDGETAEGETVTHSYSRPGDYEVTLIVTDEEGEAGRRTIDVRINPTAAEPEKPVELEENKTKGPAEGPEKAGFELGLLVIPALIVLLALLVFIIVYAYKARKG